MRKFVDAFSKYVSFVFALMLLVVAVRHYFSDPEDEGTKYLLIGSGMFGLNFAAFIYNEQSKKSK